VRNQSVFSQKTVHALTAPSFRNFKTVNKTDYLRLGRCVDSRGRVWPEWQLMLIPRHRRLQLDCGAITARTRGLRESPEEMDPIFPAPTELWRSGAEPLRSEPVLATARFAYGPHLSCLQRLTRLTVPFYRNNARKGA